MATQFQKQKYLGWQDFCHDSPSYGPEANHEGEDDDDDGEKGDPGPASQL